jgi:glycosyltransferase involved in cell wall biosynthesis
MKVLLINQHPFDIIGGSEIQCDIIATYLTRFGHQVVYLAVKGSKTTYDTPYPVIPIENLNPFQLYRILKKAKPDVAYWRYNRHKLLSSAIVLKLNGVRFVFAISSLNDSRFWIPRDPSLFKLFSAKMPKYSLLLAFIKYCKSFFVDVKHFVNFAAVPLFVDGVVSNNADYFAGMPVKKKIAIHNSMTVEAIDFCWPKPYVAWVSSLKRIKNPEKYYQLAYALQNTGVDFLMIGIVQEKAYDYLVKAGEKLANFHFLGPRSPIEVNGILKNALFLVHTCDPEGFPGNMIQAWLQGKPTISLYFDPEGIIEKEEIGYFSRSFEHFVEQTRFLIENKTVCMSMGQKAQRVAKNYFDSEFNVRKLEAFLSDLLIR